MDNKTASIQLAKDGVKIEFEPAILEVIVFSGEDIIRTSGDSDCIEFIEYLS